MSALSVASGRSLLDVFLLFSIPIGGGIPAGVLLAQSRGIGWLTMTILYFCSDIMMAILFEPVMLLVVWLSKRSPFLTRFREELKKSTDKIVAGYGAKPSVISMIAISFGVDPITGRAAAMAAGHNFFSGWAIAIAGDMLFFTVIMVSMIWLNNILGDGTLTAIIITAVIILAPMLYRHFKNKYQKKIKSLSSVQKAQ